MELVGSRYPSHEGYPTRCDTAISDCFSLILCFQGSSAFCLAEIWFENPWVFSIRSVSQAYKKQRKYKANFEGITNAVRFLFLDSQVLFKSGNLLAISVNILDEIS